MDERFNYMKNLVVNFKLDYCCFVAPVRFGLFSSAYFNIIFDLIAILNLAEDGFQPTIMVVQASILEDDATKPIPVLCYAAEFAFNVLLLAACYRKDTILLRVYMYFVMATLTLSIMFYSVIIVVIGVFMKIALILSILFQCYIIILVRSEIVEIKLERRKAELPTLVMSTLLHQSEAKSVEVEVPIDTPVEPEKAESVASTETTEQDEHKKKEVKLETVREDPKEEV